MCTLKDFRIEISRKEAAKIDMVYECMHMIPVLYMWERGDGGRSKFLREMQYLIVITIF